jgi:hypothetical protein
MKKYIFFIFVQSLLCITPSPGNSFINLSHFTDDSLQVIEKVYLHVDRDTLKAFASKPIIIYNNSLGYKITYYLDKFEYYKKSKSFLYKGSAFFTEDMADEMTQKKFFDKRRKSAYLGSRRHFFRSFWTNSLKSNGFIVKNTEGKILNYEDLVIERSGFKKYLSYKGGRIYVCYLSKSPDSYIIILKDPVFF